MAALEVLLAVEGPVEYLRVHIYIYLPITTPPTRLPAVHQGVTSVLASLDAYDKYCTNLAQKHSFSVDESHQI